MLGEGEEPGASGAARKKSHGRSLSDFCKDDIGKFIGLRAAEERLRLAAEQGHLCSLTATDGNVGGADRMIRAGFLRFLLLGGDEEAPVHERGVHLEGATVTGNLNLDGCGPILPLLLRKCEIQGRILARNARLSEIDLSGSSVLGITCDFSRVFGSVRLNGKFRCLGEARFVDARISGEFDCQDGAFVNREGVALYCRGIRVTSGVQLTNGFRAEGEVHFCGSSIGWHLLCSGGSFETRQCLAPPVAEEVPSAADALCLVGARIAGNLWLGPAYPPYTDEVKIKGSVNLQEAHAKSFVDSELSWPEREVCLEDGTKVPCFIRLDGFTYVRFARAAPTIASVRKKWLERQPPDHLGINFRPQPFEQLMTALQAVGHFHEARRIGIFRENLVRPLRVANAKLHYRLFVWATGRVWGFFCGYGYRPHRLITSLLCLWLFCGAIYYAAARGGGVHAG
jgi:hypothetical protein